MSTRSAEFHVAVCDGCGESLEDREDTELCWGMTPDQAVEIALDALWDEVGDRLLCPGCQPEMEAAAARDRKQAELAAHAVIERRRR